MAFATRCHLKIPYPSWAKDGELDDGRDFENWKELQRWADDFYKNCTTPKPEYTFARKSVDQSVPGSPVSTRVEYNSVQRNDGDEYDGTISRLTSRKGGLYLVNFAIYIDAISSAQRVFTYIRTGATEEYRWVTDDRPSWNGNWTELGHIPVLLTAGEWIEVWINPGVAETLNVGTPETSFLDIIKIA